MITLAFTLFSATNFMFADYKHVVATSSIEIEPAYVTYETFEVTAYTLREHETGKGPDHPQYGHTALSGRKEVNFEPVLVEEGITIACPPSLPFLTQVYIPYFDNTFTCTDRGGAIKDVCKSGYPCLDVYMESEEEARKFGRQHLEVVVR